EVNTFQSTLRLGSGALARQSKRDVQTSKRRTQFVGDVVKQARLRLYRVLQALRHCVEVPHKLRNFIAAAGTLAARSRRKIALRQPLRSRSQPYNRRGQIKRQ